MDNIMYLCMYIEFRYFSQEILDETKKSPGEKRRYRKHTQTCVMEYT